MVTSHQAFAKFGSPENHVGMATFLTPLAGSIRCLPPKIYMNKAMLLPLTTALSNVFKRDLGEELHTFDGCFCIRKIRGYENDPQAWSLHSWGIAIDFNAKDNPLGKEPTMSPQLVACFTDAGFDWGGNFSRKDGMHFQLAYL